MISFFIRGSELYDQWTMRWGRKVDPPLVGLISQLGKSFHLHLNDEINKNQSGRRYFMLWQTAIAKPSHSLR